MQVTKVRLCNINSGAKIAVQAKFVVSAVHKSYNLFSSAGDEEVPLTFKIRAKRYPCWHYAIAGVLSIFGSAFWAWVASSVLGLPLRAAWQVFFVFSVLQLSFLPLMYFAYEKQFRNHRSRAVPKTASALAAAISLATLYFVGRHELLVDRSPVTIIALVFSLMCIVLGVFISLFFIRYEVE